MLLISTNFRFRVFFLYTKKIETFHISLESIWMKEYITGLDLLLQYYRVIKKSSMYQNYITNSKKVSSLTNKNCFQIRLTFII